MRERWKGNSIKKADDEKDQTDFGEKGSRPSSHRDAGPMWGVATASPREIRSRDGGRRRVGRTDRERTEGDVRPRLGRAPPLNQAAAGAGWVKS
jgi:hypothetical protein